VLYYIRLVFLLGVQLKDPQPVCAVFSKKFAKECHYVEFYPKSKTKARIVRAGSFCRAGFYDYGYHLLFLHERRRAPSFGTKYGKFTRV
jgi:hypothetical protein